MAVMEDRVAAQRRRFMQVELARLVSPKGEFEAPAPQPFRPASAAQLAALEHHWGNAVPPSIHDALSLYDGDLRLCHDLTVLSIADMIADRFELRARHARAGSLSDAIFARGNDARHALAFDFARLGEDSHEPLVVRLIDGQADVCWQSFLHLCKDLLIHRGHAPLRSAGQTTYDLWTNGGIGWEPACTSQSRGFDTRSGVQFFQQWNHVFTRREDIAADRFLSAEELAESDRRFTQAVASFEDRARIAIFLGDRSANELSYAAYVYYEPSVSLVMALTPDPVEVSLTTDSCLDWSKFNPSYPEIKHQLCSLLAGHRIFDAFIQSTEWAVAQLHRQRSAWPAMLQR